MDLRRRLAAQNADIVPILKLIPNSATDEQIYFYIWVQEDVIASRVPIPASRNQRCVELVKNWIMADVESPTNYAALLKLHPLTYTTSHYTELFKYCANRKQIFTPEAIKKIETLLGFTTPNILYNLLETMKSYPTYQQYALSIAYFLHIDDAYHNKPVFLNFVADGPSPTTSGESVRSRWAKWGNIIPRIVDSTPRKELAPQNPTVPLKPIYMPSPNINQAARVGFSVTSKRAGESSGVKITNPQKAGGPGIKMRSDNYITPPKPTPPIETNIVPTDEVKVDPEELLERIEKEALQRDQLENLLTTELSSILERIEKEALQRDQLEELLTTNLTARVDSTAKHFSTLLEQAKSTETKLSTRLQAVEKAQRLTIQQNVLKSVEKKLTTDLENTAAMLTTRLETIDQAQQAAEATVSTRLEHAQKGIEATVSTRLGTIEQAQQAIETTVATRLESIEQTQQATESTVSARLKTIEHAQQATESTVSTRLKTIEQAQQSTESTVSTRLKTIEQAQQATVSTRLKTIEQAQQATESTVSTRLKSIEQAQRAAESTRLETIKQAHQATEATVSTRLGAIEQAQKSAETKLATRLQVIEQAQKRIETRSLSIENSQRDKRAVNQFSTRLQTVERRMLELDNRYQKTLQHLQTQIEASTKFSASYPWSKIDFSRVRECRFGEINNSDLVKVVLLQELLVKYADKNCK